MSNETNPDEIPVEVLSENETDSSNKIEELDNMDNNARSFIFFSEKNQPIQKGAIIHKTNKSSFIKEFMLETHVESIIEERI